MLQGVIFDLDGTLVESESVWIGVIRRIVESFGKVFDPSFHQQIRGAGSRMAMQRTKEFFGLPASIDELDAMNIGLYNQATKTHLPAKRAGADALLTALTNAGIPFALATGAPRQMAERVLMGHDWSRLFAAVVTIDDVARPKPAPDTFLEAARRLGCDPTACIAFEDAARGVESAKAAGMKVIGIIDQHVDPLTTADRRIRTFEEITVQDLLTL